MRAHHHIQVMSFLNKVCGNCGAGSPIFLPLIIRNFTCRKSLRGYFWLGKRSSLLSSNQSIPSVMGLEIVNDIKRQSKGFLVCQYRVSVSSLTNCCIQFSKLLENDLDYEGINLICWQSQSGTEKKGFLNAVLSAIMVLRQIWLWEEPRKRVTNI